MSAVFMESLFGFLNGLIYGTVAFFTVMLLSIVYRYFTKEKLSSFIGILFGLGFLGFSGGLLAILDQPTLGGVIEIIAVSIFIVWGVNTGDKIAEKIPKKTPGAILEGIRGGKPEYTKVKLPCSLLIYDIIGKPRVSDSLKAELSEREFNLPADLPLEDIANRVKRRLVTDWGIGNIELELDKEGKVIYFAISAKERGLSPVIPEGSVAIPIECHVIPSNLAQGDFVKIFLENNQVIERIEVKGVNEEQRVVTVVADLGLLETIQGKKSSLVVALPYVEPVQSVISVEQKTGEIEYFKFQKIINSLEKAGITNELAKKVVNKVKSKLNKMDPPISTKSIKAAILEEMDNINPEVAKKLKKRKLWKLKI